MASGEKRQPWPESFAPDTFVREVEHPKRWGKLIGPGEQDQWTIQYATGARMTAADGTIEAFTPTAAERNAIEKATAFYEKAMERQRSA